MYTLIGTAKLNDVDPQAWLADVIYREAFAMFYKVHFAEIRSGLFRFKDETEGTFP